MLTDVPAVIRGYGTLGARQIRAIDGDARSAMTFPAGSMGPKVEACVRFVRATGQPAAIGALTDAAAILAGRAWHHHQGTLLTGARSPPHRLGGLGHGPVFLRGRPRVAPCEDRSIRRTTCLRRS